MVNVTDVGALEVEDMHLFRPGGSLFDGGYFATEGALWLFRYNSTYLKNTFTSLVHLVYLCSPTPVLQRWRTYIK